MQAKPRVHSIHAMRAIASLLGIAIHGGFSYTFYPIPEWGLFSPKTSIFFDYWVSLIHMFRLPVFFFLAGFLGYESLQRLSTLDFVKRRFFRIVIPLVVITALLNFPLFLYQVFLHGTESWKYLWILFYNLRYLWFLQYLITYYVIVLLLSGLVKILNPSFLITSLDKNIPKFLPSFSLWVFLISINFLALYSTHSLYTPVLLKFVPSLQLLIIYGLSFSLGWFLAKHDQFVYQVFKFRTWYFLAGTMSTVIYFYLLLQTFHENYNSMIIVLLYVISSWFWFFTFIALCLRFFNSKNRVINYLSGASYWIYLIHVPIVGYLQTKFIKTNLNAGMQYLLVFSITLSICLITYQLFVKRTSLGDPSLKKVKRFDDGLVFHH